MPVDRASFIAPAVEFREEVFGGLAFQRETEDYFYLNRSMFELLRMLDEQHPHRDSVRNMPSEIGEAIHDCETSGVVAEVASSDRKLRGNLRHDRLNLLSAPLLLEIYPLFNCNERCKFCYVGDHVENPKQGQLEPGLHDEVAAKAKEAGIFNVTILGGEPFLYKSLDSLIEALAVQNLDISLSSNGTIYREEVVSAVKRRKVKLNIALHSHVPEISDFITGKPGGFERTVETVRRMVEDKLPLHITAVLHQKSLSTIQDTVSFLGDLGIKAMTVSYAQPASYGRKRSATISFDEYERAFKKAFFAGKELGIRVQGSSHYNFLLAEYSMGFDTGNPIAALLYGDKAGRSRLEMMPSGDLYPTSFVFSRPEWKVANLITDDLLDAWINHPALELIRNRVLPHACEQCSFGTVCGGGLFGPLLEQDRWSEPPDDCPIICGRLHRPRDLKSI